MDDLALAARSGEGEEPSDHAQNGVGVPVKPGGHDRHQQMGGEEPAHPLEKPEWAAEEQQGDAGKERKPCKEKQRERVGIKEADGGRGHGARSVEPTAASRSHLNLNLGPFLKMDSGRDAREGVLGSVLISVCYRGNDEPEIWASAGRLIKSALSKSQGQCRGFRVAPHRNRGVAVGPPVFKNFGKVLGQGLMQRGRICLSAFNEGERQGIKN